MNQASIWQRHPDAERFIADLLGSCSRAIAPFDRLAGEIHARTGTRIIDWVDHFVLADGAEVRGKLSTLGFTTSAAAASPAQRTDSGASGGGESWAHPEAVFPRVVLAGVSGGGGDVKGVAIAVEDIATYLARQKIQAPIEGAALGPYRRARAWSGDGLEMLVVERRGYEGVVPPELPGDHTSRCLRAYERWRTRSRGGACSDPASSNASRSSASRGDLERAMRATLDLANALAGDLGPAQAAWLVFVAERDYWQSRSHAGRAQRARQDALGLGWANHDHHTFRSSRVVFPMLIRILETLGFRTRERFHAGSEAGWGAQVLEQPACRLVVFADVDLAPEEIEGDFAHGDLLLREEYTDPKGGQGLGTVGLWCALHGESMLEAGLHHLAARADFDALTAGLDEWGVRMLKPFSDFPFLKQAFTAGERWIVDPTRIQRLTSAIDAEAAGRFAVSGAIGSHLENIQRAEGFKGFNQTAVSDIIRRTDPRGRGA